LLDPQTGRSYECLQRAIHPHHQSSDLPIGSILGNCSALSKQSLSLRAIFIHDLLENIHVDRSDFVSPSSSKSQFIFFIADQTICFHQGLIIPEKDFAFKEYGESAGEILKTSPIFEISENRSDGKRRLQFLPYISHEFACETFLRRLEFSTLEPGRRDILAEIRISGAYRSDGGSHLFDEICHKSESISRRRTRGTVLRGRSVLRKYRCRKNREAGSYRYQDDEFALSVFVCPHTNM